MHIKRLLHWGHIATAALMTVSSLALLLVPWLIVQAIDRGIEAQAYDKLYAFIIAAALAQTSSGFLAYWAKKRAYRLGLSREMGTRARLYHKIMAADLRELPDHAQGSNIGRLIFAASSDRQFIETLHIQALPLAVASLGTLIVLLTLSWPLALMSFALFPLAAGFLYLLRSKIRPASRAEFEAQENLYRQIIDDFRALIPIRAMGETTRFGARFDKSCAACITAGIRIQGLFALQTPFFDILQAGVLIAVFAFGGHSVIQGTLSIGVLLGFQLYLARLFSVVRSGTGLFASYHHYVEGRARAKTIEALRDAPTPVFEQAIAPDILKIKGMSFSLGDKKLWENFDLNLKAGDHHSILLPSGSGKTSLARCILGLYPLEAGSIAIPEAKPKRIGFVPQDNALFDASIRDNICLISGPVSDEHFDELVEMTQIGTLIERFGDDSIGENGQKLSGGEQRRVMLARAMASDVKLLIIDQMTSDLEDDLAQKIFSNISRIRPELAILYLGHRSPWAKS